MAIASEVKIRRCRTRFTCCRCRLSKGHENLPCDESFMRLHQLDECRLCRRQKHSRCSRRREVTPISLLMAGLIFQIFSRAIVAKPRFIFYIVDWKYSANMSLLCYTAISVTTSSHCSVKYFPIMLWNTIHDANIQFQNQRELFPITFISYSQPFSVAQHKQEPCSFSYR